MNELISRQAVIDALKEGTNVCDLITRTRKMRIDIIDVIKALPSVNSTRAHGEWIEKQHFFGRCSAECSICGKRASGQSEETAGGFVYSYTDFCPNCGADMREVQHE